MQGRQIVTTVGRLNCILGVIMLPWAPVSKFGLVVLWEEYGGLAQVSNTLSFMLYVLVYVPVGLISSAMLMNSGRGLLMFKRSARALSIVYGLYALAVTCLTLMCCRLFWIPVLERAGRSAAAPVLIWETMGASFGVVLTVIHPAVLLFLMMLTSVKGALQPPGDEG